MVVVDKDPRSQPSPEFGAPKLKTASVASFALQSRTTNCVGISRTKIEYAVPAVAQAGGSEAENEQFLRLCCRAG